MAQCKRKCCCGARGLVITLAVTGIVLVVIGLAAQPAIHALMRSVIKDSINMENGNSQLFDVWSGNQVIPEYMTYYVFNCTNAQEVQELGAYPNVEVIGPFTYREENHKFNITWSPDDNTVRYKYNRTFTLLDTRCDKPYPDTLEPPLCTLDDNMTFITGNYALVGFINQIAGLMQPNPMFNLTFAEYILLVGTIMNIVKTEGKQESLFMKRTVFEAIWGAEDPILALLFKVLPPALIAALGITSPVVGLQYNNSVPIYQNWSSIKTGNANWEDAFSYVSWAGNDLTLAQSTTSWKGCAETDQGRLYRAQGNMLNGTEGMQFRPLLDENSIVPVYAQDILRSSFLHSTGYSSIQDIDLLRFRIVPWALQNSTLYPPNCAFSNYGPSGVLNMTDTQHAPVFASKPMFYDADPIYRTWVTGLLDASEDKHDTFLDIEPWTGSTMHAHQRLQVNLQLVNIPYLEAFWLLPPMTYLPIMWADEWAVISDDLADEWKSQIGLGLSVATIMQTAGIASGLGLLGIALVGTVVMAILARRREAGEGTPLLKGSLNSDF